MYACARARSGSRLCMWGKGEGYHDLSIDILHHVVDAFLYLPE